MSEIRYFEVTIAGDRVMMHNDRLSDPLDKFSKALKTLTGKRQKTDDEHEQMARIEFEGGLYIDPEVGPYLPGKWLFAAAVEGARARKLGKTFERSIAILDEVNRLNFEGPRTVEGMYADKSFVDRRSVGVGDKRIMRTRPIFRNWSCTFIIQTISSEVNPEQVEQALDDAALRGIGDGRPMFAGRFTVKSFKEVKM